MSLKDQLMEDMKTALKAGDKVRLNTIRFLLSELKNAEIDLGALDDSGIIKLVGKQIKQMKEAIIEFERGQRPDLIESEQLKISILEKYLPAQLDDEAIKKVIAEIHSGQPQLALGQLIGQVVKQLEGKAESSRIAQLVKSHLGA